MVELHYFLYKMLHNQLSSLSWQIFNIFWLKLDVIYDCGENHHGNIALFMSVIG